MDQAFVTLAEGRIAYQRQVGDLTKPSVLFLGGFASNMEGTKASFLAQKCQASDISLTRFDYRGCGRSDGLFTDMTIGDWLLDARTILDIVTAGPQIIIGSSMGGWLAFLLAQTRPSRTRALIGIAAAPDFTQELIWKNLTSAQRTDLIASGRIYEHDAPLDHNFPITLKLIEEARAHLIFDKPFELSCPVRLLQGTEDKDVPPSYADRISRHVKSLDLQVIVIEKGDHRLSRPEDLDLLWQTVASFG